MIFLGSDHAGFDLKEELQDYVKEALGLNSLDMGCFSKDSVDYPDIAKAVCDQVIKKNAIGILVCGTGIGMSISANKIKGIRAALCRTEYEARMARAHNHANVLCLGGRITGTDFANDITKVFLETKEEGDRHQRRVEKIMNLEC